jgi:hypothetical protein
LQSNWYPMAGVLLSDLPCAGHYADNRIMINHQADNQPPKERHPPGNAPQEIHGTAPAGGQTYCEPPPDEPASCLTSDSVWSAAFS